jgi:hypothetical protein
VTRFIVFTSPRSGSSWLIDLLDAHQRVGAYAELFLPGDRTEPSYGSKDLPRFEATLPPGASSRRVMLAPRRIAYLNRLYSKSEMDAVGFKLMYGHPRMHPGLSFRTLLCDAYARCISYGQTCSTRFSRGRPLGREGCSAPMLATTSHKRRSDSRPSRSLTVSKNWRLGSSVAAAPCGG